MKREEISSGQNSKIKELLALQEKSKLRREKKLFVVEGRRELEHCLNSGFKAKSLFVCPEIIEKSDLEKITELAEKSNSSCNLIEVPVNLYNKIAYRGGTEGVIAEMVEKDRNLHDIQIGPNPLIVVLEAVEKPGNLGAILRTADAAGVDAVVICDPLTDIYNPNLIRASIGAVFTRQVVTASSEEAIKWLKDNEINILTAQLQDSKWYYDTDMSKATAIVLGAEDTGLTEEWRKVADAHIKIPMQGNLDSLNVSVSAAILLFEAVKQRNRKI